MILIKSVFDIETTVKKLKLTNKKIGFVATMGALHDGHISLIERSKAENDTTICSIFVNPLQFNDSNDLIKYPKPIDSDIEKLLRAKNDILFLPEHIDIYPKKDIKQEIDFGILATDLEGAIRPGHFNGVAVVVKRLFDIIKPEKAYFGQKDWQQILVIQKLVNFYKLPIQIVVCEILREKNGLAMSSRNVRLSLNQRENAGFVFQILKQLKLDLRELDLEQSIIKAKNAFMQIKDVQLDYLQVVDSENLNQLQKITESNKAIALVAVNYGGVRLIDNIFI